MSFNPAEEPDPQRGAAHDEPVEDTLPIDEDVLKRVAETNARVAKTGEPEPPAAGPYADPRD